MLLLKKAWSNSQYRDVELYQHEPGSKYFILILKKIPGERMSADVRKLYRSEKQALKQFCYYTHQ